MTELRRATPVARERAPTGVIRGSRGFPAFAAFPAFLSKSICQTAGVMCKFPGMPELPDIVTYIRALQSRIVGERLIRVRVASTFLLRSAQPPIREVEGHVVRELRRIGKRIAIGVENDLWLVLHLMIAGRLHWRTSQASLAGRNNLAAFDFPKGSLILTEAGTKRRASLHLLSGEESLRSMDPGGIDLLTSNLESFRVALSAENRTLKRALTDPRLVSGIGNAYSDEILHAAQLSPITLTHKLKPDEWERLFVAARQTLDHWTNRLQTEAGTDFPENVTAFHEGMAVLVVTANRARDVAKRFSGFVTPITRQTTAPDARPVESFSPIAVYLGCSGRNGPALWKNWRHSNGNSMFRCRTRCRPKAKVNSSTELAEGDALRRVLARRASTLMLRSP